MHPKRILFISGSGGLGHVTRDLAIAAALRKAVPGTELSWLAAPPASDVLREAGEPLAAESSGWADVTQAFDRMADTGGKPGYRANVTDWFTSVGAERENNLEIFRRVVASARFDLIVGDEAYEIAMALRARTVTTPVRFVMIYDFIGLEPMSWSLKERIAVHVINRRWAYGFERSPDVPITTFFIGELEDVPDTPFWYRQRNRREWARQRCTILGYILPFDPAEVADRAAVRARLGYGPEPLVVSSVGGTGAGEHLLGLSVRAFGFAREKVPDLRMVVVCGPRVRPDSVAVLPGVEVRGYVPALYEHFAACDLAVIQGGGTSTLELTALGRPFLYFPLQGHAEQQNHVAARVARHGAGVRMDFRSTTPTELAEKMLANLGASVHYAPIRVDGAVRAAEAIRGLLEGPALR